MYTENIVEFIMWIVKEEKALIWIVKQTGRLWWRHAVHLTFFNAIWLVLQIPIVTGPPVTAAMYAITHRLAEGDLVTPTDVWRTLCEMFIPAWKWGAVNILVVGVIGGNVWISRHQIGDIWIALRFLWSLGAAVWITINIPYWPLWLAESDRRLGNTLRNSFVLLLRSPGLLFSAAFLSLAVFVLSIGAVIPLVVGGMVWIACIGLFATEKITRQIKAE